MWVLCMLQYVLGFFGGYYLAKGNRESKVSVFVMSIILIICAFLSSYGFHYLQNV